MNVYDYAKSILFSEKLEDKLLSPSCVENFEGLTCDILTLDTLLPARSIKISLSKKQIKFPKKSTLHLNERKALALHFFANHELLAIEMMAAAILYLPIETQNRKRIQVGILQTIKDEQKHFSMYRHRMNDFGVDFGDYPVNDFFWRQMQKMKSIEEYMSVVALTFEAANLDFAKYYSELFNSIEDHKTSKILNEVYKDEISHVSFGVKWLNEWRKDKSLWFFYQECLPDLLTPARSKGIGFDESGRLKSGMDIDFVNKIKNYRDDFIITTRKELDK